MTLKEGILFDGGYLDKGKPDGQKDHQYTEEIKREIAKGNASPEFLEYLEKLGLVHFFPEKVELMDIMKITNSKEPEKLSEIPLMFLKNIIMINYKARDKMLEECLDNLTSESEFQAESRGANDQAIDILSDEESEFDINPIDLTVAIFKCASPSLIQILSSKLFVCQLAIPFCLPMSDNFPVLSTWSLRSIILEEISLVKSLQHMAIDCPCHVVGFCRLGRPAISKSKLINEILSEQYHSTCLTKDSPLGTSKRIFSDGLIESTWYQPSEKSQILTNILFFLNLRGDGAVFTSQLDVMRYLSSVAVVLVEISQFKEVQTKEKLQQFHERVPGLIIAIDASKQSKKSAKKELEDYVQSIFKYKEKTKYIILAVNGNTRSFSDIKKEMRKSIFDLSNGKKQLTVAERLTKSESCNFALDENITTLQLAKEDAEKVLKLIPEKSSNVKNAIVPLQGKPWQEWSEKLKSLNKTSRNFTQDDIGEIKKDMTQQRRKQTLMMENSKLELVRVFVEKLADLHHSDDRCVAYVLYLKSFLDKRSRSVLPKYLAQYQTDWQALKAARDKKEKENLEKLRTELDKSEMNLAEASFGLEHLLREIGQMYEAAISIDGNEEMTKWCKQLPNLCATLLLKGQPFEIMDGDVANVPLLWVTAVLNQLKALIGDKKMLALSVLGIQSSGKSTLLNTMFGLQFAVSAGRCTRGVFMQLVPVDNGILPFDYVLVIDTEGLRAPELAHQKHTHDNELATYVIGLGDITIVNIKGENTAEVKDVLQIAVHAFLRLKMANKKLNLKQSCVFVHQNVPARDATEKMMQGRQKLVETLDEMTKEAAYQESFVDIESFNQVIDFDSESDVWYFSDLWQGDPPMAPANPGYSRSVRDVKNAILFRLTKDRATYLTITDTITRIEDLWNGIIKDDFVFSFRNSLELKAFNSMDIKCQASIWEMEKFVFEFVANKGKTSLMNCKTTDDLENAVPLLLLQLQKEVHKKLLVEKEALNSFIDQSSLKDVMKQWSQSRHNKLAMLVDNLTLSAKGDIIKTKDEIKVEKIRRDEETNHEMEINEKARKIANEEKGRQPSDTVIKEKFETMWNSWINKFDSNLTNEGIPVKVLVESVICDKFQSDAAFISGQRSDNDLLFYQSLPKLVGSLQLEDISASKHLSLHKHIGWFANYYDNKQTCKKQAVNVADTLFRKIDLRIHEIEAMDVRFSPSFVTEILHIITKDIDDHNKHTHNEYKFDLVSAFRGMLIRHVSGYISEVFTRLNNHYMDNHSPKAQMERYKETVWTLFTNVIKNKTEDTIAAGFFRKEITKQIIGHIQSLLPIDVQEMILISFSHEKYSLMKEIMIELAKGNNFENIKLFIKDPQSHTKCWLENYTFKKLFQEKTESGSQFIMLAKRHVEKIFFHVLKSIQKTSKHFEGVKGVVVSEWRDFYLTVIRKSNCLPLPNDILVHTERKMLSDVQSFSQTLEEELNEMKSETLQFFNRYNKSNIHWKENPIPKIMEKLWGCPEICMFCNEPCKITDKEHFDKLDQFPHQCIQHRPQGIGGWRCSVNHDLKVDFCNFLVQTDDRTYISKKDTKVRKYKEYKQEYPNWDIQPTSDTSKYWIWIMCKYHKELTKMYNTKPPKIPSFWKDITQQQAIESL